jgi:hypothetical protein
MIIKTKVSQERASPGGVAWLVSLGGWLPLGWLGWCRLALAGGRLPGTASLPPKDSIEEMKHKNLFCIMNITIDKKVAYKRCNIYRIVTNKKRNLFAF